jgi:CubicO group peptidase (beta-lactamase class C family)
MSRRRTEIERLVARASRGHHSLAVGTYAGGEATVHEPEAKGAEPLLFELGSITKPFTGALLAELALAGEVGLDDPVTAHLPDDALPRWQGRPPTLSELATHQAALPNVPHALVRKELAFGLGLSRHDPWADIDAATYARLVRETAAAAAPGRRVSYSSLGYGVLGAALTARTGKPYETLLRDRIALPLGLASLTTSTDAPGQLHGYSRRRRPRPPLRDHMPAAGAIRTTAPDLLAFLTSTFAPPTGAPGPALTLAAEPRVPVNKRLAFGLGWMILQRRNRPVLRWHSGGTWGFRSFAATSIEHRTAVVVLTNTARSIDKLGFELIDTLYAPEAS